MPVCRLLARLALCMAQVWLFVVHAQRHGFRTRHTGLGHCNRVGSLGTSAGTDIASYRELHEQQAYQRKERCDQAVTTVAGHG